MNCLDIQPDLSFFADGSLDDARSEQVRRHLDVCPVCRQIEAEVRGVRFSLGNLQRSEAPRILKTSIMSAIDQRRYRERERPFSSLAELVDRIRFGFAPFGIGTAMSLLIGFAFLASMFTRMGTPPPAPYGIDNDLVASNARTGRGDISPADYARSRLGIASESPSVNPNGALVRMTQSLMRGGLRDDEVVVVADVFSDGVAQIAEVVEPSRNRRAVVELEKALASDPSLAPFVPTTLESRPDSVRVVLKFQSVNVNTGSRRSGRHRL